MKFRALIVPVALILTLAGCAPEPGTTPPSPSTTLSPSPAATPSATPTSSGISLEIPGDCGGLVPLATIRQQFGDNFVPISYTPSSEDVVGQSFAARGGLTCLWGIPGTEAGVTVFVAERATATDAQQVAQWQSAGYTECPPFLDECFYAVDANEMGEWWTAHVLVEGFELQILTGSMSIDPLLVVARAASTSMGYI